MILFKKNKNLLGLLALLVVALSGAHAAKTPTNDELNQSIKDIKADLKTAVSDFKQQNKDLKSELKTLIKDLEKVFVGLIAASNKKISELTQKVAKNKADHNTAFNEYRQTNKANQNALEVRLKEKMNTDKTSNKVSLAKQWTDSLAKFEYNMKMLNKFKNSTNAKLGSHWERINTMGDRITDTSAALHKRITDSRDNQRAYIDSFKENTKLKLDAIDVKMKQAKVDTKAMVQNLEDNLDSTKDEVNAAIGDLETSAANQQNNVMDLARQTMLQQFSTEERARSAGDSGVKILRGRHRGPENYYETGLFGPAFNMMHDHSNYHNTVGMGELCVVMNGVEFRTRHNDYKLLMPSSTDKSFHATEPIPFPDVPPSVANAGTVDDQILEMREYFKAFKNQDSNHRDYKQYFKPVLCYLEGSWTLDTKKLDEPFDSDRHSIDASSWFDLQEKVRWASYTGTKSRLENFSNLPTTIMGVNQTTGQPKYAQWNYRILCQPLKEDVPLAAFKLVDDLAFRVPREQRHDDVDMTRGARYRLESDEDRDWAKYRLLDRLMSEVPGKDNQGANIVQESFGEDLHDAGNQTKILNTGYYSRAFAFSKPGAMGLTGSSRGFNDANMWVAQTTQERIAGLSLKNCDSKKWNANCTTINTRMSYAIPIEIIYLTPLMTWNPYNLQTVDWKTAKGGEGGSRGGGQTLDKAYKGVADKGLFYRTPVDFFGGRVNKDDPADTVRNAVGVLDPQGNVRPVTASGVKIFTQNIEGVGKVRLRYPITPIHGEGSAVWKELNALKDAVKGMRLMNGTAPPSKVNFEMATTTREPPGEHSHDFSLTWDQYYKAKKGQSISVETTEEHGHTHKLVIKYTAGDGWRYTKCDKLDVCWDGHASTVTPLTHVTDAMLDKQTMMNIMGEDMMDMMMPTGTGSSK